jgi:hypothetical protein
MRHRNAVAVGEYRLASTPRFAHGPHTCVRAFAYQYLLALLAQRAGRNGVGALDRQALADFGTGRCYGLSDARSQL